MVERRRDNERVPTDVPVMVTTIMASVPATIVNLHEQGALINGASAPAGMRMQVEYEGQTVFATVAWNEPDRCGVRFPLGLHDGPLHRALVSARMAHDGAASATGLTHRARMGVPSFGRRGL